MNSTLPVPRVGFVGEDSAGQARALLELRKIDHGRNGEG